MCVFVGLAVDSLGPLGWLTTTVVSCALSVQHTSPSAPGSKVSGGGSKTAMFSPIKTSGGGPGECSAPGTQEAHAFLFTSSSFSCTCQPRSESILLFAGSVSEGGSVGGDSRRSQSTSYRSGPGMRRLPSVASSYRRHDGGSSVDSSTTGTCLSCVLGESRVSLSDL